MHAEELRAGHVRRTEFPQVSERIMRTRFVRFCQDLPLRSPWACRRAAFLARL